MKTGRQLLAGIFKTKSFQESSLLTLGTVINSLLGLFFYILVARALTVSGFGYFSFLLGIGMMAAEVFDLGLTSALVRFGSGSRFTAVFSLVFWERLVVSGLLFFLPMPFKLAAGVGASLLFINLVTQGFLARQKYSWFVATNIFGNLTRLGLVLALIHLRLLTTENSLLAFTGANLAAFALGFLVMKQRLVVRAAVGVMGEVFSYSRFLAVSFGLASVAAKIDIPLVYLLGGGVAAGIYSSAQKLASVFMQVAAAVDGVFAPKFARAENFPRYFREYGFVVVVVASGLIILMPLAGVFIPLFFGAKYAAAVGVFSILIFSLVPFFLGGPLAAAILYRFGKSNYHLLVSAGQLVGSLALYAVLIPKMGASGAAVTAVVVNIGGVVSYYYFYRRCLS